MRRTSTSAFHTTSWTMIVAASGDATADSQQALASLCQTYWRPVYAFIRKRGYDRDQAEDLTQSFFAQLLDKHYLRDADRERGRFRSFLLTAVKHFLANQWDRSHALKRGGGAIAISIDAVEAERWYVPAATDAATPERLFERRWALSVLEHVMARLRAEFVATGREEQFERLMVFLNRDSDRTRYEAVATQLGVSSGALRMAVHRLRRRYRELLRSEIAQTVSSPDQTDEEIRFLMTTLST
jgi:RNA polymerase sigma-70 factor (ECF subfamily)